MRKTDILVTWPQHCDYPLWRQFIRENRRRFDKVIIVFTNHYQKDNYSDFIKSAMLTDEITFLNCPFLPDQDWRHVAITSGLSFSNAEWVWFTEQDFLPTDNETFWRVVESSQENYDYIGVMADQNRLHPCCLFVRRDVLGRSSRNFAIVPGVGDHFFAIQRSLELMAARSVIISPNLYNHMNGLSHNFTLVSRGEPANYKPGEFRDYLSQCLKAKVPLDKHFVEVATNVIYNYAQLPQIP